MKKRASAHERRPAPPAAPDERRSRLPLFRELSGARGVRAHLESFLESLNDAVRFERASLFFLPPGGAAALQWAGSFWRARSAEEEPVVGLSPALVAWAMADARAKVAPPGALGDSRRVYLFLPLWGLGEPLGLAIVRTLVEAEGLDVARLSAVQGLAAFFGERIAYAVAYLGAEAEHTGLARHAALSGELLDAVAEGLLAADRAGKVLFVNRNARIMLQLWEPEYRGGELAALLPPAAGAELAAMLGEAREKGAALARQVEWQSPAGALPLELSASRIISSEAAADPGLAGAVLVVIRNLAAGARLARLEEIDRLKSEFISTVSHELKSPLSTVKEAVNLLTESAAGRLPPEQARLVDIVGRNVDWLVRLINDLLDMSRLEAGRINLDRAALDVDGLVASVAGRFQVEAARKRLEFRVRPGLGGARVPADRDRLEQVLVNLIANAFKFTPAGFVEVATAPLAGGGAEIRVGDSGVGIAKEDLPLIFDKFEQVGRRPELSRKGTGLGLAISRKLVELHGGEIRVESEPGRGSAFIVRLPGPGQADGPA